LRGAALALFLGLTVQAAQALEPGVSRELARWRATKYREVQYALSLRIAAGSTTLEGAATIDVTLPRPVPELVLDWRPAPGAARLGRMRVNGRAAEARFDREHLIVSARLLRPGRNRVTLTFESPIALSGSAVTRYLDREDGSEYVYTLFVPSDASSVFPCFDQPDLKARFTLDLVVPRAWTAIGSAPVAASEDLPEDMRRFRFAETPPISTYVFAFAAGPFKEFADRAVPTRIFVRRSQASRGQQEAPEVLRLNREGVRWFERYFDFRYPFPKYDLVLIPEFAYGGMEHAGATFLREESVLFPSSPNETDVLARAQLILHEASHQWFGDLVTMRWFDDLWLKEGFANFMAAKAAEAILPEYPVWNAFHALKTEAYRTDATLGTTPIYRPLSNLSAAKATYGNIVYGKAPGLLRQVEFYIGAPAFQQAVRQFVRKHAFAAADWNDLIAALENASRLDLKQWAEAWVTRPGMPEILMAWDTDREGRPRNVVVEQRDIHGKGRTWPMKLTIFALPESGPPRTAEALLDQKSTRVRGLDGMPAIDIVFANLDDYGYGRFLLDPASQEAALERPQRIQDPLLRSLIFDSLWESVRDGQLAPLAYIDLVIRVASTERDPVTLASLLGRAQVAFRRYSSSVQRDAAAPRFERFLVEGMLRSDTQSRRITFFRTFAASAWSETARAQLKALLAKTLEIPGVPLSSRDRFRIIARLLALEDPDAGELLALQSAADTGDDGRRYAFAAGAAKRDAEVKRAYFERLVSGSGVAEGWVEAALLPFNAVEHADLTQPFLDLALAALPEFRLSHKIFFVNNWLAAFVGGQVDAAALEQVESFARQPELDPDLRLQLLEAMDGLARTVRIRGRFASILPRD